MVTVLCTRMAGGHVSSPIVLPSPIEAATDDTFYDPVIGGGGRANAHAEVDLPVGADVEVDGREELLLLIVKAGNVGDAAVVGVVFEAAGDLLCKVVADFCSRREVDAQFHVRPVPGAFKGWIDGEVPWPLLFIDDGANLPGPGVGREERTLVADLSGEAYADWPVPVFRNPDPGADVVANPLDAKAALLAGEDVEAHL